MLHRDMYKAARVDSSLTIFIKFDFDVFGTGGVNKCASLCGEGLVLGFGSPLPHTSSYESLVDLPNLR